VGDTHANRSVKQESEKEQMTQDTYGPGLSKPLASYDHDTQSWKTYGDTSLWEGQQLLENLPTSGITVNGDLYQQPAWKLRISGKEFLLWPTPTAVTRPMEGNVRMYRAKIRAGEMTEAEANAILGKSVWEAQGRIPACSPPNLNPETLTGKLNPTWVEWLMGFPAGWTDLKD
jgi:hypothetical protein